MLPWIQLRDGLEAIEFLDPKHPKKLMERLPKYV
jgi:hypothetical protein